LDLLGNSEIKKQSMGNQGSGKKIQAVDKKGERRASYRVATHKGSNCLARVK